MFSRQNRYEPVATGAGQPIPAPAQPGRRVLQMVVGLFAVIGVFVAVVLTREGSAVDSYTPAGECRVEGKPPFRNCCCSVG